MFTKEELITHLEKDVRVLQSSLIKDALQAIDRVDFIPEEHRAEAYADYALPIGYGQTISQPTTVVFMLELLSPQKGEQILDVGSGSGWTTALLSHIVGEAGSVIGVELVPELVVLGKKNIAKYNFLNTEIMQTKEGTFGVSLKGPYDKILVSATARKVPETLLTQLKNGGIMVLPVGEAVWQIYKKKESDVEIKKFPGFLFVPLI